MIGPILYASQFLYPILFLLLLFWAVSSYTEQVRDLHARIAARVEAFRATLSAIQRRHV